MSYGGAYSYSEQIYRAAELTAAGVPAGAVITTIAFYNATGATTMSDLRTYMGHRSTTSYSSTTDWTPFSTLVQVDSGDWVTTGIGWFDIQLDQPFIWNGVDNLVVAVSFRGAHSDYSSNNPNCGYQYTVQSANSALRRYSTAIASCDPTSTAAASTNSTSRPNLRIAYIVSGCPSLTPSVADIGPNTVTLNWMNYNQSAVSFDLAYGEASTFDTLTSTVITGLTDTFYTINNLTAATAYKASIKSHCSTESGTWSAPRTFTTLTSCPTPGNLAVSTVNAYDATVTWTPGYNETSWELVCVPAGTPMSAGTIEYPTSTTYMLSNLTPNTAYEVYVRANCGSEYSYWTSAVSFRTSCVPITALPFMENFDSYTGTTSTGVSVNNLPSCWANINHGTSTSYSGYPIIYNSAANANSGTNSMRFYTYITAGTYDDQMAVLPAIDQTAYPMNTLQLTLDARAISTSYVFNLVVGVLTNPTDKTTFVPVDTINTQVLTYGHYEVPFTNYTGTGTYIGIMAPRPISGYNEGYVDNIVVETIPSCSRPTQVALGGITTSSVTVDWAPAGQESVWEVVCVPQGQSVTTATPEAVYAHPHTIYNLNDDTRYEVYVRATCVNGGYSSWSSVAEFTTDPLCTPPTNVTVSQIAGTSALVSWNSALVGADSYTVEYSEHNMNNWIPATVSVTSYMLSSLMTETSYDVRVFSNCQLGDADTVNVTFLTECLSMSRVALEDGTASSSYIPVSNSNNYSMSQQIYLASELNNTPMNIKRIAFEYTYSVSMTAKNNVDIYLGHTAQSSFVTNTSWVTYGNLQKVYSGSLNCRKGWNTFVLDSTFHYNGVDNLVLVVDDNSGSSNGSTSYTFAYKSQSPNYMTLYYYNASTNPNPQNPPTATTRSYNRDNVRFMSECDLTATCIAPNVFVSDVTESTITVDWAPGNYESSWQMEYSTNGSNWTTGSSVTAPYTLSNLTPNTNYYIRMRSDCGGGDYSPWTIVQAHTPCAAATLPLTEDFDAAVGSTTGNMVDCWSTLTSYTSAYPYASTSYHHSGTHSVYFYGPTPYYSYLISPRLDDAVQMNNLEVSFWAYKTSANYFIQMGVMSDPSDPNTFEQMGSNITPSAVSTWEQFELNTALYTGQSKYIAFRVPGDVASYMYIDDIDIHELPTCPHVQNIHTVSNTVTSNSADIAWTAGGTEQEWIVVYGPEGTILNPDFELATATTVYTPSISLTNLNSSVAYDVYVKSICSSADSSRWHQYSFRTECGYISMPFSEGFESFVTGSANPIPCWTRNSTYNASYPYVTTTAATGVHGLYFYGTSANYSCIALPSVEPTVNVNTLQVECNFRSSNTSSYKMIVGVMTNPSDITTFSPVETLAVTSTGVFQHFEVPLSSYTGTGSYIAFKSVTTGTSSAATYLDDIRVSVMPTCRRPVDVEVTATTSSSATINWTARNGETDWQVVVVPHGQPVTSGTPEYVIAYPYTVQNLTDATEYDVYVKSDCGNNDLSDWSEVVSFHTKCLPTSTIPYFESFEGVGSGSNAFPTCWSKKTDYTADPYVNTSYHSQGSASLYFYATSACYMYAASQALDLSNYAPGELAISYKLMPYSSMLYARIDVGIMTDPDDPATFTCLRSHYADDFTALNTWHSFSIPLNQTYSTPVYVTFFAPVSYSTKYMYVDEVKVDYTPTCSAPTNLTFSNVAGASAVVSWLDSQYGDGDYTVEYSSDNVTWSTEVVTGTSLQLSGLTPNTIYYVHVYRNCVSGNSNVLSGSFSTGCLSGGDVAVGNGTTTTYSLPVNNYYKYCFTQQIYLASEMGGERDITSLSFDYAYTTSMTAKNNVSIYLGNTTQSTFSSTTNYVPITNQQLVYTGPLNCHQGWNTFNLTTPFHYNGTSNLVITIDDNSNNKNSNSYTFHYHSAGATRSLYYYSDTGNPDPSNPTGASTSKTTTSNRSNIIFGSPCDSLTTCIPPTAYISARDYESLTVTWAPGSTESTWEFEYKAANDANWTQVPGATSPTVLSNLTANTVYNIRLRSDCGGGDYSDWRTLVGETECNPITVPYFQNFDSTTAATGAMVPCWTRATNNSTAYPYLSTSYSESSPNAVYFYSTTMYYAYLASPRFDDATVMDSLLIRFKARKTSTTYPYFIEVGIMTDPNDYSTFTAVGSFAPSSTILEFEDGEVRTDNYTGNGKYVAFRSPRITNYMYLDDVQIDYIPNCLHAENVHAVASTITPYAADVIWTPGGDETEWDVVVAPAGSVTNPNLETPQTIYGTPTISLTNLAANTLYEVFVQGHCSNGESSVWEVGTFRTACAAISSLPYMEDFESYPTGSSSNHILPNCWDYVNSGSTAAGCPTINSGSSYATGKCLYFYSTSAYSSADQIAILPEINTTTLPMNTLRLSFDARRYQSTSTYVNIIDVGVMESSNQFVLVDTVKLTSTTISTHHVDFANYTGTGNRMAIRVRKPDGSTFTSNYNYLDNIKIDVSPSCSAPTSFQVSSLTSTSVDLTWTDAALESTWQFLLIPANQVPDYTQAQTLTANSFSETNLTANTAYKAYLRTVCSNGLGYSEWVMTSFTTPCLPLTTLPFSENFDSYAGTTNTSASTNNLPSCWANYNNGTSTSYSGYPIVFNSAGNAASGSNSMRFYTYITAGTYDDQVAILPPIDATTYPVNTLMLAFDAKALSSSYIFELVVGVMTNPSDMSTFVPVQTIQTSNTSYRHYEISLAQYTGTGNFIAIKAPRPTSGYNEGNVDNILVDLIPDCSPVNNLTVTNVAGTSALLSWDDGVFGTPSSYMVEYAEHGTNNWTPASYSVSASPYLLGGLDPTTNYDVRVKTNCNDNTESGWTTAQFVTTCLVGGDIQVGNGTATAYTLPVNNYYHFTSSQQIYLASELNGPATFRSVSFDYAYGSASTKKTSVVIYLGHTTKSVFTSTSDYVALSNLTQVYSGPLNCHQGWNTFNFTTPFQYNGTDNLVLVIDDNSDQYDGSAYVFHVHSTGSNYRSLYYYSDSANPNPSNPPTASSYSSGNRSNVKFGGDCDSTATCVAPNMYVSSVTSTSATITWVPGYMEGLWNVEYQVDGDTTWTPAANQTSSPATLSNLNAGTFYKVRMRSDCGGGDVSEWVTADFATECDAVAIPIVENFDTHAGTTSTSVSDNNLPICWNYINTGTNTSYAGYPIVYNSSSTASSGLNSLRFYAGTGTYGSQMAILPEIDVTQNAMNTLQVSFDARALNTSYPFDLTVGILTDPTDITTFVPIDTVTTQVITYGNYEIVFSHYTGTGAYIGLLASQPLSNMNYGYVDNVRVDLIPTCPKPQNLTVSNSTQNSVTLNWTETGTAQDWIVEYGPTGYMLGTGTTVQVHNTPTTTITGLSASTTYDFYVQADCGGGDVSSWSIKATGVTQCAAISQLPYTENFDSYGTGTAAYPNCWGKINTYTGGERPYCNSSYGYNGSTAGLYFYTTGTMYNIAITPELVPSIPVNTLKAKFMFRGLSGTSYTCALQVGVMTNPMDATTFVAVDTVYPGSSVATYESREVSFANYTGTGHYIAFKHGLLGGSTYYAMMDNLIIELDSNATPPTPPTCPVPTGLTVPTSSITQTTATASWNAGGTETAWDLQYKQQNASNWGNAIPLTARTYNFTGLTAGTQYDVRVRANCGNNDVSDWTNAVTFQTQAQGPGPNPCEDPTGLTASNMTTNSVVLEWTENGTSTSWTINYQETGVAQWSTATANEHPYTLTGLQPATTYQAYVVANCDDGPSGVSNMVTFTTEGVGINDYEQMISLYPNPNNGRFTINNEQFIMNNVQVYDVYGKLLKTIEADANTVELDVRELSAGMYFVRISTEKGVVTKSFVKK
ncbi:MAG: fibronectin type III domain-containing protein [Bacteroidales bacterium]|nr:fibronectin type III domain-containing protein [Bacteroidales bacterium]